MDPDAVDTIRRMAGLATPMTLRVAVTLGLPDRLLRDAVPADRLAADLGVSSVALSSLLGHLVTLGVAERTPDGYRTTAFGANLCADAGNGLTDLLHLDAAGGRAELAFVELAHTVATGEAGYPRRYGQDFWADLSRHPHLRESFERQMTWRFREQIPQIVAGVGWDRFPALVDVGGGNGTLLAAVLAAHPGMRGRLVELEQTAAAAARTFDAAGLGDRVQALAGSFFEALPSGADAYLLCDILHDWDDDHAHAILARCVEAARPAGRVLVIEPVGGHHADSESDLAMLVMYGGRERSVDEFRDLADPHGLTLVSVAGLSSQRCVLEFELRRQVPT